MQCPALQMGEKQTTKKQHKPDALNLTVSLFKKKNAQQGDDPMMNQEACGGRKRSRAVMRMEVTDVYGMRKKKTKNRRTGG